MELLECSVSKDDKVSGPSWSFFLIRQLYLSGVWFSVDVRTDQVFKRDWITCSKYDNHSRLKRVINIIGGEPI